MSPLYLSNLDMNKWSLLALSASLCLLLFAAPAAAQVVVIDPGNVGNPFPSGLSETFSKPAFGDIDNDGLMDAISGSKDGTIVFLKNNGAGAFTHETGLNNPLDFVDFGVDSKINVAVADLNGDTFDDVLVGKQDGTFTLYLNTNPGFDAGTDNPMGLGDIGNNASPYLVDYDADGDADLFIGEFAGNVNYFRNDAGTFSEQTGSANPFDGVAVAETSQPAVGDLDGDGDHDLALGSSDGTLQYYEDDAGTVTQRTGVDNPFDGFAVDFGGALKGESGPAITDVDGDGEVDVVVGAVTGDFYVIQGNGSLPVELASFNVVRNGGDITLNWTTASEANNAGFEIEHRTRGRYSSVGWVRGAGTSTEAQSYSFTFSTDEPGRHTFRLKQVDFDGTFAHSRAAEVAVDLLESHFASEVYPNPFNPTATFSLVVSRDQQVTVAVYDIQGRMVELLHSGAMLANQNYQFHMNGSSWSSGKYLVRAVGEAFESSRIVTLLK